MGELNISYQTKYTRTKAGSVPLEIDSCQGAKRERRNSYVGDAIGDRDAAGQAGAVKERIVADAGDAVAYR